MAPRPSARSSASAASKPTNQLHGSDAEVELLDEGQDVEIIEEHIGDLNIATFGLVELKSRAVNGTLQYVVVKMEIENGIVRHASTVGEPCMYKALAFEYLERAVQAEYIGSTLHDARKI